MCGSERETAPDSWQRAALVFAVVAQRPDGSCVVQLNRLSRVCVLLAGILTVVYAPEVLSLSVDVIALDACVSTVIYA